MVRVTKSVFTCGANREIARMLARVEEAIREIEGGEERMSNTQLFTKMVRFLYWLVYENPEMFRALYTYLRSKGAV